jgi:hypothetical protein
MIAAKVPLVLIHVFTAWRFTGTNALLRRRVAGARHRADRHSTVCSNERAAARGPRALHDIAVSELLLSDFAEPAPFIYSFAKPR